MTLRELGYSIQDAFANVGEWFQEMLWIAFNGSWFDLTIGQFIVFVVIVGAVLYMLALMAFEIVRGIFRWLASLTKVRGKELAKEAGLLIIILSAIVMVFILLTSLDYSWLFPPAPPLETPSDATLLEGL